MANKPQWAGLTYVDLFAGPGVCRIRDTAKRLPGSPIVAARAPKPFRKLIFVEKERLLANSCRQRLEKLIPEDQFEVLCGDCNELCGEVAARIPDRSLTLAFIDPEGFDVPMSTLETLAAGRRVDFLLLWADAIDLVRNVDVYEQDPESKLYRVFGDDDSWKGDWAALQNRTGSNVRALFSRAYQRAIRARLGYAGMREKIIHGSKGSLYRLLYASKHERGLQFWDKISVRDLGGQSEFNFGA